MSKSAASPKDVRAAAASFGAIGGKSGKGACKRRDPEHYRKMAQLSAAKRRAKKEAAEKAAK